MQRRAFEHSLSELLRAPVEGLSTAEKLDLVGRHAAALTALDGIEHFTAGFVPFVPGRRPIDEIAYPGLGSSQQTALYHLGRTPDDELTFLVRCSHRGRPTADFPDAARVLGTIEVLDHRGASVGVVSGWDRRDLRPLLKRVVAGAPTGSTVPPAQALVLDLQGTFAPEAVPVDRGRYLGFASLFHQRFRIVLDVEVDGARVTGGTHEFEVHNEQLYGSLYQRLLDVLLPWDVARQARAAKGDVPISVHPWYPVLSIGTQKARFYMQAISGDLVQQRRMLTDPGWLLRVGLYLELLTCLGVAEAVKGDVDILTPEQRTELAHAPEYGEIRRRIDPRAWQEVWALRDISFGGGLGGAPTGGLNLLRKKAATLAFLHAHHEDLKNAIDLAGPNLASSQETWHRVFRDAERAVLQVKGDAFPELAQFPALVQWAALWHQTGTVAGTRLMPRQVTELFGDQDGVFPAACNQYRDSMNHVAAWARERGLMEYTGDECVPLSASLLRAYLDGQTGRLAGLQRHDGYEGTLEVVADQSERPGIALATIVELLQGMGLASALGADELHALARRVRPIELSHHERIIVQGREGTSIFILQEGTLEVIGRVDGVERHIAILQPPAVVGEIAFLLGEKRSATVRAVDGATVLEVGADLLRPLVEQRPAILENLQTLVDARHGYMGRPEGQESVVAALRRTILGRR